ncbi:MoxR family ATPase [Streptomyces sp. DSM 44915]|uniref:MoxR family ATPase n=1 Tax=Streptomyces chisholmiae TaxID=3075540 RepID=A0ABU2JLP3_9ACTN|nr:MoxR family ATPase [Streptomyces sp. DSM 44915]MDT0265644.1 MoxR family ATPase [Streptomyces sp. DSM 44915]
MAVSETNGQEGSTDREATDGEWLIYRGTGERHEGIHALPKPPPWRDFDGHRQPLVAPGPDTDSASDRRLGAFRHLAEMHRPSAEELEIINAALYLRRPLLVTGSPGTGKSTLAHSVAFELGLGRVLHWPIVSRSRLEDGLYHYDAIARLQDTQIAASGRAAGLPATAVPGGIGSYLRLGPLGTALLPTAKPRVLLIDELDKSDIDLPNDLLNVLEEGEFSIPELQRIAEREPQVEVLTDDGTKVTVREGRVRCHSFPFVVLTSNGERDFPAPLLRRCIPLQLRRPDHERLATVVRAHLGDDLTRVGEDLISRFLERSRTEQLATDQLLNAIYLTHHAELPTRDRLADMLIQRLDQPR